jgi:hypothetical protein
MSETITRPTAFAACAFCAYLARLTGDTELEVGTTLRGILLAHVADAHPDRRSASWRDVHPIDDLVVVMRPATEHHRG